MKRIRLIAAWGIACALLVSIMLFPDNQSGLLREEAVRSRYGGWSGVLRLWVCEGWQAGYGSLSPWLSDCIAKFEKRHNGVYIQLTEVSAESLQGFAGGTINPPDMILFAPGMLEETECLLALGDDYSLRSGLEHIGHAGETRYALPIAVGGYAIAYNQVILDALPLNWSALADQPAPVKTKYKTQQALWLNCPSDGAWRSWSAALIGLLSGTTEEQLISDETPIGEGIDLGLPQTEQTAAPERRETVLINNALPTLLPDSFRQTESVYSDFTGIRVAAMTVTQREIRRLQVLSDSGKAPDWAVGAGGSPFTDQVALLAVTDCARSDLDSRQTLCQDFAALLITPEMQEKLTKVRALPVVTGAPLYANQAGMAQLESALAAKKIIVPPAFDNSWRAGATHLADLMQSGALTPAQAMAALEALFLK